MAHTYIIYSNKLDRFYIGACQGDLASRVDKHNVGHYGKNHFTSKASDWIIYLSLECTNYPHAIRLERKIKSMKSKIYIQNLKKYPELREKIVSHTANS